VREIIVHGDENMALEKLPEYFKIKEDITPLMFYYYDERKPEEKSCIFTNLKNLVHDCKLFASTLKIIEGFELPEGFRIEQKIYSTIAVLYFENLKIKTGDVFELESIARKNHSIYRQLNDLNEGKSVEL
jgi:hypothetical protein